jgi:hypothetical protein
MEANERITIDLTDPRLGYGSNDEPVPQNAAYLVLPEEEREKGFVRPLRHSYLHLDCGKVTFMGTAIAETYARNPSFYGATYCCNCQKHRPVGAEGEFVWCEDDGQRIEPEIKVGT